MPISIDEFESHNPGEGPSNAERVLAFLARNRDQAFKAREIADGAGVNQNSIHPVLLRLEERSMVRHREPYWAMGDLDVVRDAHELHELAGYLDEELGVESREEWLTAGDSDEEHRG